MWHKLVDSAKMAKRIETSLGWQTYAGPRKHVLTHCTVREKELMVIDIQPVC